MSTLATPRVRLLRLAVATALAATLAVAFGGCQVALKADPGDVLKCDVAEGAACPGHEELVCLGGTCRMPPGCVKKPEVCNGVDDDCDGVADEGFDQDADTYIACGRFNPDGTPIPNTIDCNDNNKDIHPGVEEVCNGADDNCNGLVDEEPNDCSDKSMECWTSHKDAAGNPNPICISRGDCRVHGCTDGGCDPATGACSNPDCTKSGGCKSGYVCDVASHNCVPIAAPGDRCDSDPQCPAGFKCIDSFAGGSICSKTCCASEDCPTGLFCKYPGNAASICVKAGNAGLTLGAKTAHASCGGPAECRSGVCTGGKCIDGCCGTVACGDGGTCAAGSDDSFLCRDPAGSSNYSDPCLGGGDCKTGACYGSGFGFCTQRCCTSTDCSYTGDRCDLAKLGSNPVTVCTPFTGKSGTKKGGDTCTAVGDCRSGKCTSGHCEDFCCNSADCAGGWVCKPKFNGTYAPDQCVDPRMP